MKRWMWHSVFWYPFIHLLCKTISRRYSPAWWGRSLAESVWGIARMGIEWQFVQVHAWRLMNQHLSSHARAIYQSQPQRLSEWWQVFQIVAKWQVPWWPSWWWISKTYCYSLTKVQAFPNLGSSHIYLVEYWFLSCLLFFLTGLLLLHLVFQND